MRHKRIEGEADVRTEGAVAGTSALLDQSYEVLTLSLSLAGSTGGRAGATGGSLYLADGAIGDLSLSRSLSLALEEATSATTEVVDSRLEYAGAVGEPDPRRTPS